MKSTTTPLSPEWMDENPQIEARLQDTFRPVNPNRDFVRDLQRRLMRKSEIAVYSPNDEIIQLILILIASIASSILIAILLGRFFYLGPALLRKLFRLS